MQEGDVWHKYWRDFIGLTAQANAANALRKIFLISNHNSAQGVRVRSASRGTSYYVWFVATSGEVGGSSAVVAFRCAPACAIG